MYAYQYECGMQFYVPQVAGQLHPMPPGHETGE